MWGWRCDVGMALQAELLTAGLGAINRADWKVAEELFREAETGGFPGHGERGGRPSATSSTTDRTSVRAAHSITSIAWAGDNSAKSLRGMIGSMPNSIVKALDSRSRVAPSTFP
jgi:hypothetical protein